MTELLDAFEGKEKEVKKSKKDNSPICIGLDVGTMNLVCARSDTDEIKTTRNVFLPIDKDDMDISQMSDISYGEIDNNIFILGESAFQLSNILGKKVYRPMENGLISPKEINAINVLTLIIKDLIGDIKNKDIYCTYSVPGDPVDSNREITYHERVFGTILSSLGINHSSMNESMGILYSEAQKTNFSALCLSFGSGMMNCALGYHGIKTLAFSTIKSGDYVDKSVSEALSIVQNRVTNIKEKYLDLEAGFMEEKNKKRQRIIEGLCYYYDALINYTIKNIIKEFNDKVDVEIDEEIPIIIGGGTSLPKGFIKLFESNIMKYDLPFNISEIRAAKSPLISVSQGLLIKTLADVGK